MAIKIESRKVFHAALAPMAASLGRAFQNDPFYSHFLPDESLRPIQLQWWMRAFLKYAYKYGEIYTTTDYAGAALWIGPEKPLLNEFELSRLGMFRFFLRVGRGNYLRMSAVTRIYAEKHREHPRRHYYLSNIGVDPAHQGRGIGGRLMAPILARAQQEGLECHLETAAENNVQFYRKNGFIVDDYLADLAVPTWFMVRRPAGEKGERREG